LKRQALCKPLRSEKYFAKVPSFAVEVLGWGGTQTAVLKPNARLLPQEALSSKHARGCAKVPEFANPCKREQAQPCQHRQLSAEGWQGSNCPCVEFDSVARFEYILEIVDRSRLATKNCCLANKRLVVV
jgi:hypothetical protein